MHGIEYHCPLQIYMESKKNIKMKIILKTTTYKHRQRVNREWMTYKNTVKNESEEKELGEINENQQNKFLSI